MRAARSRTSHLPAALRAALLATMLLAASCAGGAADEGTTAVGGDVGDSPTTAVAPGDDGSPPAASPPDGGGSGGGGAGPGRNGDDPGSGGGGGGAGPAGGAGGSELPSPHGPPGSFAPGYLRPEPASRIVVELLSHDGIQLRESSVDHSVGTLGQVTGKAISVVNEVTFGSPERQWTGDSIRAVAEAHARQAHGDGRAVLRVLMLRGEYGPDGNVIGVAVQGDTMAVFVERVQRISSPLTGPQEIEKAVTLHEVGHLLGLVDLYLRTGRADPDHPGHSGNRESVMYWAVESSLVGELLGGGPPTRFDQHDLADLRTIAAS